MIEEAIHVFDAYVHTFDMKDPLIALKYEHTFGVIKMSTYLCEAMQWDETATRLAQWIALLHDIGRFEQARTQHNFYDYEQMDHAEYGVKLLFEEGWIRRFIKNPQYDACIRFAIANHSRYQIDACADADILMQAKLIRDSDKLDNFLVKLHTPWEILLIGHEPIDTSTITDAVYEQFMHHTCIDLRTRKTSMDMLVSYLAFIYDINFAPSLQWLCKEQVFEKLLASVHPKDEQTMQRLQTMKREGLWYMQQQLGKFGI